MTVDEALKLDVGRELDNAIAEIENKYLFPDQRELI